jgi:prephenate dehydrogenase
VPTIQQLAPHCAPGTLITDAGSTKESIVRELDAAARDGGWPAGVRFVGSHPLAGNEKKGPQHSRADLFVDRTVVVTPGAATSAEVCRQVGDFWRALGARVVEMSSEEHDRALAMTSHLPHLVASAIAGVTPERYVTLTAGGWQDTTRIAAGNPQLWRQILLANPENVLAALKSLTDSLADWKSAIESADIAAVERLLAEGKRIRDSLHG